MVVQLSLIHIWSKKALKEADLVLLVLNASEPLTDQDRQLLEISQDSNRIRCV